MHSTENALRVCRLNCFAKNYNNKDFNHKYFISKAQKYLKVVTAAFRKPLWAQIFQILANALSSQIQYFAFIGPFMLLLPAVERKLNNSSINHNLVTGLLCKNHNKPSLEIVSFSPHSLFSVPLGTWKIWTSNMDYDDTELKGRSGRCNYLLRESLTYWIKMQLLTISAEYKQSLTILTIKTAVTRVLCQAATHWLVSRAYVTRASIQTVIITDPPLTVRASEACHAAASRFP